MRCCVLTLSLLAACGDEPVTMQKPCDAWRDGPRLNDQRFSTGAVLLGDGRILVVGGHFRYSDRKPVNTNELVDLEAGVSTPTSMFTVPRTISGQGATMMLPDGRVLSASPWVGDGEPGIPAEIFDPATETWTVTAPQSIGTGNGVVLPDGRVLVAGGIDWASSAGVADMPLARSELFDGTQWQLAGEMSSPRTGAAVVVAGGRALVIGGFAEYPDGAAVASSERFDAATGTWGEVAPMVDGRAGPAVVLADGRVLVAGGTSISGGYKPELASAEIYDPVTNEWSSVANMNRGRSLHTLTLLGDGRVLALGGAVMSGAQTTSSGELYDVTTNTWTEIERMPRAVRLHSTLALPDGKVIVVGGDPYGYYATALYQPCARE